MQIAYAHVCNGLSVVRHDSLENSDDMLDYGRRFSESLEWSAIADHQSIPRAVVYKNMINNYDNPVLRKKLGCDKRLKKTN